MRARMRAGTLTQERLELAAYCGNEWALCVGVGPLNAPICTKCHGRQGHPTRGEPHACFCGPETRFGAWIAGLSCWGHNIMTRAAVAAWRAALRHAKPGGPGGQNFTLQQAYRARYGIAVAVVDAAEAWLTDGADVATEVTWDDAWSESRNDWPHLPAPWASPGARASEIEAAARIAGEPATRAAIQAALTTWALA